MKAIAKTLTVEVVKLGKPHWWYDHLVGQTIEVMQTDEFDCDYRYRNKNSPDDGCLIWKKDCRIIHNMELLQEQLQEAKATVETIEKQIEEEVKKEALRPLTQEQYDQIVAQYRACQGRVSGANIDAGAKWGFIIDNDIVEIVFNTFITMFPFGVAFKSKMAAKRAITEVGADNLKKAWMYELNIGLQPK